MKKLITIALLLTLLSCEKEKCYNYVQTKTSSISPNDLQGYPKTETFDYVTCGISKRESKAECRTVTIKTYSTYYGSWGEAKTRTYTTTIETKFK